MPPRLHKTAADYIAIGIGPALIMALVGSLVFFLLEVFYQGDYEERLRMILGLFVFAAVLIGRISIEEGKERAMLFAAPLAMATGLAIAMLVEHRGPLARIGLYFDWGLLAVIWWCAHKLVWDCTMIDEQQDASGHGLLQRIGLDSEGLSAESREPGGHPPFPPLGKGGVEGTTGPTEEEEKPLSWWQRLMQPDKRPHTPGVWVVYFSLAALPIFGIGQLFVPTGDLERRQYVFRLLATYVASGLGLLITTSFLGIRRYLRQRQVEMPGKIAGNWIGIGIALALGLLAFAMLLPRPNAEYSVSSITGQVGSPQRDASRYAPRGEGAKDKNNNSRSQPGKDAKGKISDVKKSGEGGTKPGKEQGNSKTSGSDKQSGGKDPGGKQSGEKGTSSKESGGKEPAGKDSGGKSGTKQADAKDPQKGDGKEREKNGSSQDSDSKSKSGEQGSKSQQSSNQKQSNQDQNKTSSGGASSQRPWKNPLTHVTEAAGSLGILMKWLFYALLAAIALYFAWKYRAELAAGFRSLLADLKNLWQRLFGGKRETAAEQGQAAQQPAGPSHLPFAAFGNPFTNGMAARLSADQLITYTFQALEAWAREHGCPREPDETPQEFAAHLAAASAPLGDRVRRLAQLYSQVCYAPDTVELPDARELELLWRQLGRA